VQEVKAESDSEVKASAAMGAKVETERVVWVVTVEALEAKAVKVV